MIATLELGTAKLSITPEKPVRLAGYANRTGPYETVREDINVRVHYFRVNERRLIFIYGDLIWWGSDFVDDMRYELEKRYGITADEAFFFASHNHSGPSTSDLFLPMLETFNAEYAAFLRERVLMAIAAAEKDVESVFAFRYDGECDLNVFRRRLRNGTYAMLPNYQAETDRRLTVLSYRRKDGSIKAITVCYPCHANVAAENTLHPDYPGIALRLLDESHDKCVSMFLQGCTADLRPNSVLGRRFSPRGYAEAVLFAEDFRDDCESILATLGTELTPDFSVTRQKLSLPLTHIKSRDAVKMLLTSSDEATKQWAEKMLASGPIDTVILEIGKIIFASELTFYVFASEISQRYAAHARALNSGAVSVSCCNGMIGYVPTASQLCEGGYEAKGSTLYFALPGVFSESVEDSILECMRNL